MKTTVSLKYFVTDCSSHINDPTFKNCLFGTVTLTKNADIDKYGYSSNAIRFDRKGSFSFPGGGYGQNIISFGVDLSFTTHIDNKKRHINIKNKSNTRIRKYFNYRKNVLY